MIDCRTHAVALGALRDTLAAATYSDPAVEARRQEILVDVDQEPGAAMLGAFADHVIAHAASDGTELRLLARAADLWARGVSLYADVASIRADVEGALSAPGDPSAGAGFNDATARARALTTAAQSLQAEVALLRDDISPMPHLPPHPRHLDEPPEGWDWASLFIGRRTEAFVRNAFDAASDGVTRAFAFGALSGYGANVAGSAYLGHVVGGPRRAHRFRDRLARNAMGSWMAANHGNLPALGRLAGLVRFGDPARPELPTAIETLLRDSIANTYDLGRTPPVPDLQCGYRRLVRQLELLDRFVMPPVPAMPSGSFTTLLFADPAAPPRSLRPQSAGVADEDGGPGTVTVGDNSPADHDKGPSDSKDKSGDFCLAGIIVAVIIVVLLVVALVRCIVKWADGESCDYFDELGETVEDVFKQLAGEEDPPDPTMPTGPSGGMTAQGLSAFAGTDQAVELVGYLFDLQVQMWEALERAHEYLCVTGLVYPDRRLTLSLYRQFLAVPPPANWPRRPEPNAEATYHVDPSSPFEHPTKTPSPFPAGTAPGAAVSGLWSAPWTGAAQEAVRVWEQIAWGALDSANLDLDADRGYRHPCWATEGPIEDDPVSVRVLAWDEQ